MKMQIMAQFLVPGDKICVNRKVREIVQASTTGDITRIAYKDLKGDVQLSTANKSHFFNVVNGEHVMKEKN